MVAKRIEEMTTGPCPLATEKFETLNFKVSQEFKKVFKGYAVAQGMSMVELLREGFELSKARRSR